MDTPSSRSGSGGDDKSNLLVGLDYFGGVRVPHHRWLPPLVLGALCALLLAACGGMVLSGLVFGGAIHVWGPCLGQSFVLFASLLAFPYIYLHVWSSRKNYSITRSRVFQHPLHSWAIVVARMDFLAWFTALVTVCVAVARPAGEMMHLRVDLFLSALAFLASFVALCAIERAADPFILPGITPVVTTLTRTTTLRVADALDESISRRASADQRRVRPVVPLGPRPLEPTRVAARVSCEHAKPSDRSPPEVGEALRPDPDPVRPASWSSQHQAAHFHQQHEPALHYHHHRPPPPIHYRPPMTPLTTSMTDWRQDWSAVPGDSEIRRDGRSLSSSLTSAVHSHPPAPQHPRSSAPYGVWGPSQVGQPPPPLPPPPPPPPPSQPAHDLDAGGAGWRPRYAGPVPVPMAPSLSRGGGGGIAGSAARVSHLPVMQVENVVRASLGPELPAPASTGYRTPAVLPTAGTYVRRDAVIGPQGLGLTLQIPSVSDKASKLSSLAHTGLPGEERRAAPAQVRIPGAYVEDCTDD